MANLNMLLQVYNFIKIELPEAYTFRWKKPNKDNEYLVKYQIFGFTFQNALSKSVQNALLCYIKSKILKNIKKLINFYGDGIYMITSVETNLKL